MQRKSTHALFECVPLDAAQVEAQGREDSGVRLNRSLGIASLAMLGVGNAIGVGIFVLTGTAAAQHAGPGIAISYLIAGLVCALTSLCYAELSSLIPSAGGAFAYARVSIGKLGAWLIGWCMIAEYLLAGATVAVGWSGYAQGLLQQLGITFPEHLGTAPLQVTDGELVRSGALVNMPAFLLVAGCTVVLMRGLRHSTIAGHLMVGVKIAVIVLVLVIGFGYVSAQNWDPFIPAQDAAGRFGWGGVLTASAIAFYSYSGFEAMSAAAVEARDPARTLPRALLWALAICVLLYVAMALVMTGLAPYAELNTASPISTALLHASDQLGWLVLLVNAGTVVGLAAPVLISLYGQVRTFYSMAHTGYMPPLFGRLHAEHRTPAAGTLVVGTVAAIMAGLLPIDFLGELVSLGILFAFASVCAGVIVLRRRYPQARRPFAAPLYPWVPLLGLVSCVGLAFTLPRLTWIYLGAWILAGGVFVLLWRKRRELASGVRT